MAGQQFSFATIVSLKDVALFESFLKKQLPNKEIKKSTFLFLHVVGQWFSGRMGR